MRSLSLVSAVVFACLVEFALPYYPLIDDMLTEDYDVSSSASSSQTEPARSRIESAMEAAPVSPAQPIDAPLTVANVLRNLQQGEEKNVFRRDMPKGMKGERQRASALDSTSAVDSTSTLATTSTTRGRGRRMRSNGKGKGGMMRSSGKGGMMMSPSGKGGMSPIAPPIPPGKGKGGDGQGCWVTIGGDGWGGSSKSKKSKKGASKGAWWNWASTWGPHKVWDPYCRIPCYDYSSSKSKSKKAKAKGKGKGGSSKSTPHCPPVKPMTIRPMPSSPTRMTMMPTRMPSGMSPTRKPTTLTRAPVPTGTRIPTNAPTAETLAPVPTVTNRTNTTTLAPVIVNSTVTNAPAQRRVQ